MMQANRRYWGLDIPAAVTRRALLGVVPGLLATGVATQGDRGAGPQFVLPMGMPDGIPGDGCYIRHGYACENTGFNTGWWHTGENWYLIEGNSAGAPIYAVADGEVVYADADYPGRVVIIQHADDLYSMYGHLDYELAIRVGDGVTVGQTIGTVLFRTDSRSPSHLHFEIRTFFTSPEINGASPRYDFPCGVQCPPGPGYWPMGDPDHPSSLGWLNPMHVIGRRAFNGAVDTGAEVVIASHPNSASTAIWSAPRGDSDAEAIDEMLLIPGQRFPLLGISAGDEASTGTSADAYRLWYKIDGLNGVSGWAPAIQASSETTGIDGRSSAIRFDFLIDSTSV